MIHKRRRIQTVFSSTMVLSISFFHQARAFQTGIIQRSWRATSCPAAAATEQQRRRLLSSQATSSALQHQHEEDMMMPECKSQVSKAHYDPNRPFFPIYYNDVYEVRLPPGHRFPMQKYQHVRELAQEWIGKLSQEEQQKVVSEFRISPIATIEELTTTHSPDYVDRYLRGGMTESESRNVGFPWSRAGVARSLSSVGGTVAAATSICDALETLLHDQPQHPVWGAHVAGGTHHAFYDRGEGFCVFSDIAVAANVVLQRYPKMIRRILIVDLDVHQGNGNAVLFQRRDDVLTFSMHCGANYFSEKQESDLDIELPAGCNDETYLATLNHWLKQIGQRAGDFDMIFFQAGVDGLEHDRLGRMCLTHEGLKRRNELVFDFAYDRSVPLVISMGGGYPQNGASWAPILEAHATVYFQAHQYLAKRA